MGIILHTDQPVYRLSTKQSLLLDGLRALAAQLVLLGHAMDFYFTEIPEWLTLYRLQELGVLIFFVLSGYLIAYSSDRQQQRDGGQFKHYLGSRAVRIYATLIPALLLIALLDNVMSASFSQDYPVNGEWFTAFINLLQLQEYPTTDWAFFGTGYPLWTLSIEWWLYILFGLFSFSHAWRHWYSYPLLLLAIGSVAYNSIDGNAPGLVLVWLIGAAGYWLSKPGKRSRLSQLILSAILLAWLIVWPFNAQIIITTSYHPLNMSIVASLILAALWWLRASSITAINTRLTGLIRTMANSSFSLYLLHFSVLAALYPLYGQLQDGWLVTLALVLANAIAVIFARYFEWHWNPRFGFYRAQDKPA